MTREDISLQLRRSYRRRRRQVEGLGNQAGEGFDEHIIRRLGRLIEVRRFVGVWCGLLLLLAGIVIVQLQDLGRYYQTYRPVAGGTYSEGILGDFTNANPLYAVSPVDSAVSKLVFASLFTYNDHNQLVGDLAKDWTVDSSDHVYTIHLKPGLTWQDGQPLTAADVVFTYNTIKNPDAQSPLNASWQGVTITAPNSLTVVFSLPNTLTAFPYSLTGGIVPEHILASVPAVELRSAPFNTMAPIGSGPFAWQTLQVIGTSPETKQEDIVLKPFAAYHDGAPKLNSFVVEAFHNKQQLTASFSHNELDAMSGLDSVPASIGRLANVQSYNFPLTDATMVFFNNSAGVLSDVNVRRALTQAVNTNQLIVGLGYPVIPVREPLLTSQLAFDPTYEQLSFNQAAASQALAVDGWSPGKNGILYKNKQPLSFNLYAKNNTENRYLTTALQKAWRKIGVDVQISLAQADSDTQTIISNHDYEALLYSIAIGNDPDVFAYWDSSQADPHLAVRLNLSEYKSATADEALEAGRTRSDPALRVIKYKAFLAAWQHDAPALGLYQPRFLYITREPVFGLDEHTINAGTDRFNNVVNWEIRQANVTD